MTEASTQEFAAVFKPIEPDWSVAAESIAFREESLSGLQVLVVEDEMLVLMDAEDMLFALGCKSVITAATVKQAIDHIETNDFDAALLDLNLNGDRSFAIADALAARAVPFAFATGYGAHGLRQADAGRTVLTKPYGIDELAKVMGDLLAL